MRLPRRAPIRKATRRASRRRSRTPSGRWRSAKEPNVDLYWRRAGLREEAGDIEGALADLTTLIAMDPDFLDPYDDRARLRRLTGDVAGALEDEARARELEDARFAEIREVRPRACLQDGKAYGSDLVSLGRTL